MRHSSFAVFVIAFLLPGCSAFVAATGTDVNALETREAVHAKLGQPLRATTSEEGVTEEFHSRRKFSDPTSFGACMMGFGMTMGLSEFVAFPWQLYCLGREVVVGHDLQFTYDASGKVTNALLDGSATKLPVMNIDLLARFPAAPSNAENAGQGGGEPPAVSGQAQLEQPRGKQ
jgi:hypothetical protein